MKTINHKKNGHFTEWWENGNKRWEGTFKNGKLNGLYMEWYMDGQKMIEVTYKNGKESVQIVGVEKRDKTLYSVIIDKKNKVILKSGGRNIECLIKNKKDYEEIKINLRTTKIPLSISFLLTIFGGIGISIQMGQLRSSSK